MTDARDAAPWSKVLDEEVIPLYYDRDIDGLPRQWIKRMMNSNQLAGVAIHAALLNGGRLRSPRVLDGRRRAEQRHERAVGRMTVAARVVDGRLVGLST